MVTVLSVIDCWCQIKWKRFSKIRFEIKLQLKTINWLCPGQRPQTEIWHQWLTWWENVDIRDTFIANFHKNKKIWPGKNIHMCMFSVNNWQQQYYSYKIIFCNHFSLLISQDIIIAHMYRFLMSQDTLVELIQAIPSA